MRICLMESSKDDQFLELCPVRKHFLLQQDCLQPYYTLEYFSDQGLRNSEEYI